MPQTISDRFKVDINTGCVTEIFKCRSVAEVKTTAQNFLVEAERIYGIENGLFLYILCQELEQAFSKWAKLYELPEKGSKLNTVIVPPEHAPVMFLKSCVSLGSTPVEVVAELKKFVSRCDEFSAPIFDAITPAEIKRVLNAAQKTYRLIDIIAPTTPLKILRFDNSHAEHNSECGIPDNSNGVPTILLYHPRQNKHHDRMFIFAHELGHALHFALTGNVDVLPDSFDKFNDSFYPKLETLKENQEAFADAVAFAILNKKRFRNTFPHSVYKRCVTELCTVYSRVV